MIDSILKRLQGSLDSQPESLDDADLDRVCALLLVEVARSDHVIEPVEKAAIRDAITAAFGLPAGEVEQLVEQAANDADATLSLYGLVQRVNAAFDRSKRIELVERMWRVALADGDLDRYEEHTIRKLADLLYVKHRDFMQAKLRVTDG